MDNGHLLSLSPGVGDIVEFDMEGKELGRFIQPGASHGFRLPNGHTLVVVDGTKYIELDKNWKPLKETAAQGHPPPALSKGKLIARAAIALAMTDDPARVQTNSMARQIASNEDPVAPADF